MLPGGKPDLKEVKPGRTKVYTETTGVVADRRHKIEADLGLSIRTGPRYAEWS